MKVINESVVLKKGSKIYEFKNLIMDCYLEKFAEAQLLSENHNNIANQLSLPSVAIKFDVPLDVEEDSLYYGDDFDVFSFSAMDNQVQQTISNQQITIQYKYPLEQQVLTMVEGSLSQTTLSSFAGRKITAIAFFPIWMCIMATGVYRIPARAILDVSAQNIYIEENMPLSITRKDTITTDAEFYSPFNSVKGFVHLIPDKNGLTSYAQYRQFGILESIGITNNPRRLDNELVIGEDVTVTRNGNKITFSEIANDFNPRKIFPGPRIFPGLGIYPLKSSYKYFFLKYKVLEAPNGTYVDSGKYYYAIKKVDFIKSDWWNIEIDYERGE